MNKDYFAHWVIGIICTVIWFWGDRAGIPPTAISLAATILPGLLGHAVSFVPAVPAVQPTDKGDTP